MIVRILCVCTGNTCRSPMLMALLAARLGAGHRVESAGSAAAEGEPASPGAVAAMHRRGLDLSAHRSRGLERLDLPGFDRVLCMTSAHAAALRSRGVPASRLEVVAAGQGGVPDPFGGGEDDYEACARVLEAEADSFAAGLR